MLKAVRLFHWATYSGIGIWLLLLSPEKLEMSMQEKANLYSQPRQRMDEVGERGQWWDRTTQRRLRAGARLTAVSGSCISCVLDPADGGSQAQWPRISSRCKQQWERPVTELGMSAHTMWVKPLRPELSQDPHTGPQEGPSCPSSTATEAAGEVGSLHSASPAPRVLWTPIWQLSLWLELLRKRGIMCLSLLQRQQFPQPLVSRQQRTRSLPCVALLTHPVPHQASWKPRPSSGSRERQRGKHTENKIIFQNSFCVLSLHFSLHLDV